MRLGIIEITPALMDDRDWNEIYKALCKHFIERDRRLDFFKGTWQLVGECNSFDELKEGEVPPKYEVLFTNTPKNPFNVARFTRI